MSQTKLIMLRLKLNGEMQIKNKVRDCKLKKQREFRVLLKVKKYLCIINQRKKWSKRKIIGQTI